LNAVVGVELGGDRVRAVALRVWGKAPRATLELAWDPVRPEEAVARLRAQLGPTRRLALSVGLAFLHPKRVKLPPAPNGERRRMIALEPDRFFPVNGESLVIALPEGGDFAFATEAGPLGRWVRAFEEWAPVELVEAAPTSLERSLEGLRVSGVFLLAAGPGEQGLVELSGGRFESARRAPHGAAVGSALPLPKLRGLPGELLCARGAALGVHDALDGMLLSDASAQRIRARRTGRVALAGVSCALALGFALWGLDRSRERVLAAAREEAALLAGQASAATELRAGLAAIDRERDALERIPQAQMDPLVVIASLSDRLPSGATVLSLRVVNNEWQIDGTALDAAALLPLLDSDPRFRDVRFLSASSRFREGERTYETFSIAFRVEPAT
jgi:hypothetical protein